VRRFLGICTVSALVLAGFFPLLGMEEGGRYPSAREGQRLWGVCYGPFRSGQDPSAGIFPTKEELREDIVFLRGLTGTLRLYSMDTGFHILEFCEEVGLECYPGAWLSGDREANEKEIQSLIEATKRGFQCIRGLVVGNEVLLRGDLSREELLDHIRHVREATNLPVSTAEPWSIWLLYPEVAEAVDFLLVHIHPYWDGVPVEEAARYVLERWQKVRERYPMKEVIVGETGWPTLGEVNGAAVPGERQQEQFLAQFLELSRCSGVAYFIFEAFDEEWKRKFEGEVGAHWGLYYSCGALKPLLWELVPPEARSGLKREQPERE